ncbi:MAG TPA: hypothetical protein VD713_01035, partial [Sphingomonadales bacterium]|nr:hypothetical protein [Sphingomonadales bacterium]
QKSFFSRTKNEISGNRFRSRKNLLLTFEKIFPRIFCGARAESNGSFPCVAAFSAQKIQFFRKKSP